MPNNTLNKLSSPRPHNIENPYGDLPSQPWALAAEELLKAYGVDPTSGLSESEVEKRRARFGANLLPQSQAKNLWLIFFSQFKSLVILLLVVAAAVSLIFQQWLEGVAIGVVLLINALIGFITEARAVRSMEALARLGEHSTTLLRGGVPKTLPAQTLVPGDIVLLQAGDLVAADLRLISLSNLEIDESSLTGESVPVAKSLAPFPADTILAERANMAFKGTALTRGEATGLAVATGAQTELGQIAQLTGETEEETTPLEKRLNQLGQRLVWVTLVIAAAVLAIGLLRGKDLLLMFETAIALAVATIPEGLPIVATTASGRPNTPVWPRTTGAAGCPISTMTT